MALVIPPHTPSFEAQLNLVQTPKAAAKNVAPVSGTLAAPPSTTSGAGLAISDALRIQIRSSAAAERNANEGIAMAQTADGALGAMTGLLEQMREVALRDTNGELGSDDRGTANAQISTLQAAMDQIQKATTYDGRSLLASAAMEIRFDVGIEGGARDPVTVTFGGLGLASLLAASTHPSGAPAGAAPSVLGRVDDALAAIASQRARFSVTVGRLADATTVAQTARTSTAIGNSPLDGIRAAEQLANLSKAQMLGQAQAALSAQANQLAQHAMSLLKD